MWIWVDVFSAGIEPGTLRITKFLKCRALHHWAMVTDESPKILYGCVERMLEERESVWAGVDFVRDKGLTCTHTPRLHVVKWLGWVFETQERKKERKKGSSGACPPRLSPMIRLGLRNPRKKERKKEKSSGPGQVLGSEVFNRVIATRLVQWLSWVFATQERKKERKFLGSQVRETGLSRLATS